MDQGIAAIQGLSQPGPDTDIADDVLEEQARGEEALMAYILGEDDQLNNQVPVIISDDEDKDGASVGASGETEYKVGAINIEDDSNETSEGTENGTTRGSEDEASERSRTPPPDESRRRAVEGMRRRRFQCRSAKQKIYDQVSLGRLLVGHGSVDTGGDGRARVGCMGGVAAATPFSGA